MKEEKIDFDCYDSFIYPSVDQKSFVLVQKKNSKIFKCSHDFQCEENYTSKNGGSLSAFLPCMEKKLLILGYKNGELEVFNINTMSLIDSLVFEDKEKKRIQIDSLNFIDSFIVAGFLNGVLSIV